MLSEEEFRVFMLCKHENAIILNICQSIAHLELTDKKDSELHLFPLLYVCLRSTTEKKNYFTYPNPTSNFFEKLWSILDLRYETAYLIM